MAGPRLNISGLLGIVAVSALGLAGLRSATTFWTSAAGALTLALLLGAALGVFLLRGRDRAACAGFALFGMVYLVLVNWDWVGGQFGISLTAGLGDFADSLLPMPSLASRPNPSGLPIGVPSEVLAARQIRVGNVLQIGRMVLSLLFGLVGGWIAVSLAHHAERDAAR